MCLPVGAVGKPPRGMWLRAPARPTLIIKLVIPKRSPPRMLKRILVPLDGSGIAERALTYATAIAEATAAEILLLRVASSHTLPGVDPRERQLGAIDEAQEYLD